MMIPSVYPVRPPGNVFGVMALVTVIGAVAQENTATILARCVMAPGNATHAPAQESAHGAMVQAPGQLENHFLSNPFKYLIVNFYDIHPKQ